MGLREEEQEAGEDRRGRLACSQSGGCGDSETSETLPPAEAAAPTPVQLTRLRIPGVSHSRHSPAWCGGAAAQAAGWRRAGERGARSAARGRERREQSAAPEAPSRDIAGAEKPQGPRSPPSPEQQRPSGDRQETAGFPGSDAFPPGGRGTGS